jgi:hypothetical protein
VGVDIAAGSWDGVARTYRCSYTIERVDGYRMGPDDIQPIGDGQRLDPDVGVATSFRLWDGDTLELSGKDLLWPDAQPCKCGACRASRTPWFAPAGGGMFAS